MSQKKKKLVWQKYIGYAFAVIVGVIFGILVVGILMITDLDSSLGLLSLVLLFISIYIAYFFHIIVHEGGHLIFGLLSGYKFCSFRIFSLMLIKENGKLKFRRLKIAGTGGQCLMSPPDLKDGKMPIVLYNLGGSILNTALGALFLGGYFLFSSIPLVPIFCMVFALIGFLCAIMNGIPMRMGTVDNDGYNALTLSKNKDAIEAFWVQLKVVEENSRGVRLKDMPTEWFTAPSDDAMKNSMVAARGVFACNRLLDEERFEESDALMAHLLEIDSGIVGLHKNLLICDRLYIELIGECRRDVIVNMLTKEQKNFMKSMKRFPSVLRTEYALALLFDKDTEKAEKILKSFEKAAKSYPYPHEIDSERELIEIAKSKVLDSSSNIKTE